jgi:hypothetical protein
VRRRGRWALRLVLAGVGLAIGIGGVLALREATLSTHYYVRRGTEAVLVLDAEVKGGEPDQTLDESVEAIVASCRLEVARSDPERIEALGGGRYRVVLRPGMDQTNERQLRGCLEDWNIEHLRVDVVSLDVR